MTLVSPQPLTENSTRNLLGGKGRSVGKQAHKAEKLTAICLENMWVPRRLTTLWTSTACYRDSLTLKENSF
jgi:hypothetical protein